MVARCYNPRLLATELFHRRGTWATGFVAPSTNIALPYDWSPDDKELLVSQPGNETQREEVWVYQLAGAPHAEMLARKLISDPGYDLGQPHFAPDGRWIVFEAVANSATAAESTLYIVPTAGGSWTRITDGMQWDD